MSEAMLDGNICNGTGLLIIKAVNLCRMKNKSG